VLALRLHVVDECQLRLYIVLLREYNLESEQVDHAQLAQAAPKCQKSFVTWDVHILHASHLLFCRAKFYDLDSVDLSKSVLGVVKHD
jgi:hypothetical protein